MSDLALTTAEPRYKVDTVPAKNGRPLRITRKVRAAIDAMVWQGLKRDDAAQAAGLKDNSMYVALSRPDVKAYYLRQLDVLRTSERARNFHALTEVRDQTGNAMARVNAVKVLEHISETDPAASSNMRSPGVVIIVQNGGPSVHATTGNVAQVVDNVEDDQS